MIVQSSSERERFVGRGLFRVGRFELARERAVGAAGDGWDPEAGCH